MSPPFEVAGHVPVVDRRDEEAVPVGRVIAQLVRFARALLGEQRFPAGADLRPRTECAIAKPGSISTARLSSGIAVGLPYREIRRGVGLQASSDVVADLERRRVLLEGRERFADTRY